MIITNKFSLIKNLTFVKKTNKNIFLLSLVDKNFKFQLYGLNIIFHPQEDIFSSYCLNLLSLCLKHNSLVNLNFLTGFTASHFPQYFFNFNLHLLLRTVMSSFYLMFIFPCFNNFEFFSFCNIYRCSDWLEREIFDMFGIFFINHFNLRRILTDYGFRGYPLLKDFPVFGYKEIRYDYEQQQVVYSLLRLNQSFRFYNYARQWHSTKNKNRVYQV